METRWCGALFLFGLATLLSPFPAAAEDEAAVSGKNRPSLGSFGVDLEALNRSVHPGDDFWEYANGGWAKVVEIPSDRTYFSQVSRLNELSLSQVRSIVEELLAKRKGISGDDASVSDFYTALLDERTIEDKGATPLLNELGAVRMARSHAELASAMGVLARSWMAAKPVTDFARYFPSPITLTIDPDPRNPDRYVSQIGQGGLGMPSRDYYLGMDDETRDVQQKYRDHLAKMLLMMGIEANEAKERAGAVYDFERGIAEVQWPLAETRNPEKTYNLWTITDLERNAPGFDWKSFLGALGVGIRRNYIVREVSAVQGIARIMGTTPLAVLQDWVSIHLAKDRALVLASQFRDEELSFTMGILGGAPAMPPRWKQAVEITASAMTDAVSRHYIERHFPSSSKKAIDDLVRNVITAMDQRIAKLSWMSADTKDKARAKLAALQPMVGYPDRWRSYTGMVVKRNDAYGNFVRASLFDFERQLARIDQPVDRREWWMMPITANAYAGSNLIVFPAAYLQPPHFDPDADPAVNYGAIGYVIGHEISHHFDDQGSKFDANGRLVNWWTVEDRARFEEKTGKLAAQFDSYEVIPGLKIRGAQTLGENIADNAGLAVAYDAYKIFLKGREAPVINGFTGDQRFFMGRAQMSKSVLREEALRQMVLTNVHTPPRWRTWGVRNHDAWYKAFNVKPGHKLYLEPADRVKIWE